jgi:SAM-dependent methyltransferase
MSSDSVELVTGSPEPTDPRDPHLTTLASYQANVDRYLASLAPEPAPATVQHLTDFAELLTPGSLVLEVGSGPGRDALELEARGLRVRRTDATAAFVDRLRRQGHPADLLDVLTDDLGGPYAAVWASAVLLHLSRPQLAEVLGRFRAAVAANGMLGFSMKEGDGEEWTTDKLDAPRYYVYWRQAPLLDLVRRCGWQPVTVSRASSSWADWLYCICRAE